MNYIIDCVQGECFMENSNHCCCFLGHRKCRIIDDVVRRTTNYAEYLINEHDVDTFMFGSRSNYTDMCLSVVTELMERYPYIRRVYVRAEFPCIDEEYHLYLLKYYDYTYYPNNILNAGKYVYVERNYEMINNSKFCIVYYNEEYRLPKNYEKDGIMVRHTNSGTKLAYEYARKMKRTIFNAFEQN